MSFNFLTVMLQATQGNPMFSVFFMVAMIAVMYFFLIRPQAKRAKDQKKFAESMNLGEKIVTTAGIHGKIAQVNEDGTLKIEVNHGTFMTIERSAISMEMTTAARKKAEGVTSVATK